MGMQEKLSANRSKVHIIRIQDVRWKETTPTPAEILACQIHKSSTCIGPSSLHELHVQVPSGNEWLKRLPLLATMTCAPLPHRNTSLPPPAVGFRARISTIVEVLKRNCLVLQSPCNKEGGSIFQSSFPQGAGHPIKQPSECVLRESPEYTSPTCPQQVASIPLT